MLKTSLFLFLLPVLADAETDLSVKPGKYKSIINADGKHALITDLKLKKNGKYTATYTLTSLGKTETSGTWRLENDTLKMYPEKVKDLRKDEKCNCKTSGHHRCKPQYFFVHEGILYYHKSEDGSFTNELKREE